MEPTPPHEFAGTARFLVIRRIGAGGMGVVYEAVDRERNARVALKTLRSLKPDALLRFKNEFRSLQDIQHPNLVSLGELFEERGQWFFTMEMVRGVHFLDYVRRSSASHPPPPAAELGPAAPASSSRDDQATVNLPTEDPVQVSASASASAASARDTPLRLAAGADERKLRPAVAQLALGLVALHRANKVHRDIKPANILVTPEGRVVILDFGLVTDTSNSLPESHLVGTFSYMAPEQAGLKPVGPAADWYSVGVLLFSALTGRLPVRGDAREVLLLKQTFEAPPASSIADVPADLDELCVDLLRIDPAMRPLEREILHRLEASEAPFVADFFGYGPHFVGRRVEIDALRRAFDAARSERGATVIVHGESGVGKSALTRRFTESIASEHPNTVLLSGRCYERESVPYKAVDGIIDALSRYLTGLPEDSLLPLLPRQRGLLGQVFPVLRKVPAIAQAPRPIPGTLDAPVLRARLFFALRDLFTRLAEQQPLVLVIDDLQRADADSLALLAELMRPPDAPRLLLVATMRAALTTEARRQEGGAADVKVRSVEQVAAMFTGDVRRLNIASLPREDARELVDALLLAAGAGADVNAARVAEEAGGHPLFIDELVRRRLLLGGQATMLRLDDALAARVEKLDAGPRQLLEIVAVAGAPLEQQIAAEAAGILFADFAAQAAQLRAQNLVRTDGLRRTDVVEPYHDRVREAVLVHMDHALRRTCHGRLALAFEASQRAGSEALAIHWRGAGDADKAADYAARAASEATDAFAFDRASRLYELALELRPHGDPTGDIRAKLGDALANAGRGKQAAEAYLAAAGAARPDHALDLRRRAAEQLLRSGLIDEGIEQLRTVLGAVGMKMPETPNRALASLLVRRAHVRLRGQRFTERPAAEIAPDTLERIDICWSVAAALGMVDTIRGADFQARGLLLALDAGEPYRVARALASEVCYASTAGGPGKKRTDALLAAAVACAERVDEPFTTGWCAVAAGVAAYCSGEWRRCYESCLRADEIFRNRCTGASWEAATSQLYSNLSLFYLGEMAEQCRRVDVVRREAEERGDLFASTYVRTGFPVLAWLTRDDPERARREVDGIMEHWSRRGFFLAHFWGLLAGAQIDLYMGDAATAHARVKEQWPALTKSLLQRIQLIQVESLQLRGRTALAAAAAAGADRPRLLREVEGDARSLEGEQMAYATPMARLLRAGVAACRGDAAEATRLLEEAALGFDGAEMKLFAAVARARLGAFVGGGEGRALLAGAAAWMESQEIRNPARMIAMVAPGFPADTVAASRVLGAARVGA